MARPVDMTKKIEELRSALQKYNGIPSQTVDRAAHANIKYYIKRYSDNPEIKALIEEYGLSYTKRDDFETQLDKIKEVLADLGRMPSSSQDKTVVFLFLIRNMAQDLTLDIIMIHGKEYLCQTHSLNGKIMYPMSILSTYLSILRNCQVGKLNQWFV